MITNPRERIPLILKLLDRICLVELIVLERQGGPHGYKSHIVKATQEIRRGRNELSKAQMILEQAEERAAS
ncbi:MAG TPA: hypothetical protein VKD72_28870 [Gemmataceae bacterium]|nr:hypothetical protein [Gemmataceae bacterium]